MALQLGCAGNDEGQPGLGDGGPGSTGLAGEGSPDAGAGQSGANGENTGAAGEPGTVASCTLEPVSDGLSAVPLLQGSGGGVEELITIGSPAELGVGAALGYVRVLHHDSAGGATCVIVEGQPWCWGVANRVGDGSNLDTLSPIRVIGFDPRQRLR